MHVSRPWVMRMRWVDLLFAHWPLEPAALRPFIPAGLELETFDGAAWLGIVPFAMQDVAPRGVPAVPRLSAFPELNVRTYVTHQGSPGVWFLSLDTTSRLTVFGARRFFHLPYVRAEMAAERDGQAIDYRSQRQAASAPPATFEARYSPIGPVSLAEPGSLEFFLTERRRLFAVDGRGRIERTEIRHRPWPLQPASATISRNELPAAHGLTLPDVAPHLRFSARVDVRAWWPLGSEGSLG